MNHSKLQVCSRDIVAVMERGGWTIRRNHSQCHKLKDEAKTNRSMRWEVVLPNSSMRLSPFAIPVEAFGIGHTSRRLDVQTAEDLLHGTLNPRHC